MTDESIREEPLLDESIKKDIREMTPKGRATLRAWFANEHHYTELVEYIDSLDGKRSDA
jgi:hypothetical protein